MCNRSNMIHNNFEIFSLRKLYMNDLYGTMSALPSLEWETLLQPLNATDIEHVDLPFQIDKLHISRNENYEIIGELTRLLNQSSDILTNNKQSLQPGQISPGSGKVKARTNDGLELTIENIHLLKSNSYFQYPNQIIASSFITRNLHVKYPNNDDASFCSVWCVNGPKQSDIIFPRGTERTLTRTFYRQRGETKIERILRATGSGLDFMELSLHLASGTWHHTPTTHNDKLSKCRKILEIINQILGKNEKGILSIRPTLICSVPDQFLPPWSNAISIEIDVSKCSTLPQNSQIEPIIEAISFCLGRRLIRVGETFFNEKGLPIFANLESAWSIDIQKECSQPSKYAFPIQRNSVLTSDIEDMIAELCKSYIDHRDLLQIGNSMWLIWTADMSPVETQFPKLSAALENLIISWYKSKKTKSGGLHISNEEWTSISSEGICKIKQALQAGSHDSDTIRKITNKIKYANQQGANERMENFFKEIELPKGSVEDHAIKSRNKAAHGGKYSQSEHQALIDTVSAYRTLINRVLLKIFGFNGKYIDYSTYGFPQRNLNEPLGGPQGDGKPAPL